MLAIRPWPALFAVAWLAALATGFSPASGWAQQGQLQQAEGGAEAGADTGQDQTVSIDRLEELVSTLEDADQRAVFLDNLKALIAAEKGVQDEAAGTIEQTGLASLNVMGALDRGIKSLDDSLTSLLSDLHHGGGLTAWFDHQVSDPDTVGRWLDTSWQLALVVVAGAAVGWGLNLALRGQVRRLEQQTPASWIDRLGMALLRCLLLLVPVLGLAGAAYGVLALLPGNDMLVAIAMPLIAAVLLGRALLIVVRTVYAPMLPGLRIVPMSDRLSAYLYVWSSRFIVVFVYGAGLAAIVLGLGIPDSSYGLLIRVLGLVLVGMVFVFVLQVRRPVATWIREHPQSGGARMLRHRVADIWHILAMLLIVAIYIVWALELEGGFGFLVRGSIISVVAMFVALVVSSGLRSGLDRLFSLREDLTQRFPRLERRVNRYVAVLHWLLNVVVWLVALAIIFEAWKIDVVSVVATPAGAAIIGHIVVIAVTLLVAVVVWELADGFITSRIAPGHQGAANARLRTLLPLSRNIVLVTICTITAITILSELGVDIGPLLAGAGVIGLAIGFGAQALVRDVITGGFIMFEDQVQLGDYVEAGGKMGTVEALSIRTMTMRDLDGYVHIVPFGEVATVTNMTRDFGYAVIDVGVAYQENTDHVLEVIREVDKEAREDETLAEHLVGDLEVFGVHALDASQVTLRVRVKTLAGYQWGVRREYFRRIKLRFDRDGIEIPFPHMTVYFGEVRGGKTPPAHLRIDTGELDLPVASGPAT